MISKWEKKGRRFIINSKPIELCVTCARITKERDRVLVRWTGKGDLLVVPSLFLEGDTESSVFP